MPEQLASIEYRTTQNYTLKLVCEGGNKLFYRLKHSHDMLQMLCSKEKYCTLASVSYKSFANVN